MFFCFAIAGKPSGTNNQGNDSTKFPADSDDDNINLHVSRSVSMNSGHSRYDII